MGRAIGAVVAGVVVWGVLWNLGALLLTQLGLTVAGEPIESVTALVVLVIYSVVLSLLAGFLVARIKGLQPMRTVWVFALIQLAIGIGVQAMYWQLMPLWYHLLFLGLVVPATVAGGRLGQGPASTLA